MIEAAALIRNLQARVRRLETLEQVAGCLNFIEQINPAADVSEVEFTSIPQTYSHLWLWYWVRSSLIGGANLRMTWNNLAAYQWALYTDVTKTIGAADTIIDLGGASQFGYVTGEVYFMDYSSADHAQTCTWKAWAQGTVGEGAVVRAILQGGAGGSAVAIDSIKIDTTLSDYKAPETNFMLYGIC